MAFLALNLFFKTSLSTKAAPTAQVKERRLHVAGMGILRIFPHLRIFIFSASILPDFSYQREREMREKKMLTK